MGLIVLLLIWFGMGAYFARKAVKTYWEAMWNSSVVPHSEKFYGVFEVALWFLASPILLLAVWVVREKE